MGAILCKITLTSGVNSYVYGVDTSNILLKVTHNEQPSSQTAKCIVDNSDGILTSLSLEGYQGVLSYGYNTSAGDEYSATAPLKVRGQELISSGGRLSCLFDLFGLPDQLNDDHASAAYNPDSSNTDTVKTIISAIMGATLACFSHTTAVTVTYDSEDSLIDTFQPKDYFRVGIGDTRWAKVKELLSYTKCVGIFKADGALHISSPTVSGVVYDYEYNDTILSTNHTFFSKVYRNRLVLPNEIVVKSSADHDPQYQGDATSAASYALLPKTDYRVMRLTSTVQAEAIAAAMIQRLEVDHEKGNGFVPMNCGQEVYDYIKITDSREGDNRIGNVGYITRMWDINNRSYPFAMGFGFGSILLGGAIGFLGASMGGEAPSYVSYTDFNEFSNEIYEYLNELIYEINQWETVPKWHVTEQMIIPVVV